MLRKLKMWSVVKHDRRDEALRQLGDARALEARNKELQASPVIKACEHARAQAPRIEQIVNETERIAARSENGYALWDARANVYRAEFTTHDYLAMATAKDAGPVALCKVGVETIWWFGESIYAADDDLSAEDVRALANEQQNRKRLRLEKAHALEAMRSELDPRVKRSPIPQDVKLLVWQRDGGRCVECGGQTDLEFDHIIPLAMGGSNTARNLQLLCADCNRRKGATLG
jgi:hypothetical protein